MFEKEAEEYAEGTKTEKELEVLNTVHDWGEESLTPDERRLFRGVQDRKRAREQGFKDGANFGYNKAKAEVEDSYRESLCNSELNLASVTEQLEELEKANEWHYPSKNELPNCDDKTLLIFIANDYYEINGETIIKKRTVLGFYKKAFINDNMKLFVEKSKGHEEEHLPQSVIAWKEIVLPELEES